MNRVLAVVVVGAAVALSPVWANDRSYARKVTRELDEWSRRIEDLRHRSEKAGAATREELQHQTEALQEKLDAARRKVVELEKSSSGTWRPMKKNVANAVDDLKETYRKTADHFR